jgi:membrane-associated phospholipid phosphatase
MTVGAPADLSDPRPAAGSATTSAAPPASPPAGPPVAPAAAPAGPGPATVAAGPDGTAPLDAVDRVCFALSSAADHGLLWLALGAVRAARTGDPMVAVRLGALLGAESVLTNGVIKSCFRRIRPPEHFTHDEPLPYGMHRPITSSFPSGHAASAFMAAAVLGKGSRLAPLYFGLAGAVAYSRVRVRMHHASDVVAGAALGLGLGLLARRYAPVGAPRRRRR